MNRKGKRIAALLLTWSMIFSLTACSGSQEMKEPTETSDIDGTVVSNATKMAYGEVWSVPSTVKIDLNDVDYATKEAAVLTYEAVRNEYENCQLLITADKAVKSFQLKTSDLKNGNEVLSADNVTVYVEKYIPYNDYTGSGNMPDALLPQEIAAQYEENKIEANKNGGLWVTVYVPKETAAGKYEGSFQLVVDGDDGEKTMEIPVSVNVYDFTLSDERTAKTLFSWRYDRVAVGELDGSIEMMTTYYEFFRDYRISLQSLPLETLSGEEYVAAISKYYDSLTTYSLLCTVGDISTNLLSVPDKVKEQILAVAAASTTEKNLFDKAMTYIVDEPQLPIQGTAENVADKIQKLYGLEQECVDIIKADNSGLYTSFKQIENWEDSILGIPSVIPIGENDIKWLLENEDTPEGQKFLNTVNCLCPGVACFSTTLADPMTELLEKYDIKMWWYTCMFPEVPGPTYHLGDTNLLSSRTVSWLQKKYNVLGNLYWDAAGYTDEEADRNNQYLDVYEYPYRKTTGAYPAGDGFLTYPGAAYGVYGPLPSIRLMSIRDGMEEYELLANIENKYKMMEAPSRENFSASEAMEDFYENLAYGGFYMNKDGENGLDFASLREKLLWTAVNVEKGLGFVMGKIETNGTTATFQYYVQDGVDVTINGEQQQPVSGGVYLYVCDLNVSTDVQVITTNGSGESCTFTQFVTTPDYVLNSLSDESILSDITVSNGSNVELVSNDMYSTDGTSIHLQVNGVLTGNELEDATFIPSVSVATSLFGELQPKDLSSIRLDCYNPGEGFSVKVRLYSGSSYAEFGNYDVSSGKTVLTLDIKQMNFKQLETADRLAFEFVNSEDGKAMTYEFYLDNMIGKK